MGTTTRAALAAALLIALTGAASARGGGSSGSGLSPFAAESGNDRSAGVNNGNYRNPRLDPYIRAYGGRYDRPARYRREPVPGPYYGYPY
ncbi:MULTISPECIES: hypothetical protein [Methylobacterium]|uniref:hypothetical protein n=1 Tax=Methylobacterium TaxID=407 RepID=UPI00104C5FDC|nr:MULTISPECIES: hypothetical protein [Methylobacterium]MDR7039674.1 hypothetical protein [Methylobacterium sp. BE186]